jgi:putative hydrolase of the HAD superfamily
MAKITALFWDVGGVLLTNAWDRTSRRDLAEEFKLDGQDFETRHDAIIAAFETGQLDLDRYLEQTIFFRPRGFTEQAVKDFIFAQSQTCPETLAIVERLAHAKQYFLAMLNNESVELNRYRIERFGLRNYFSVFLSSCFLGVRKPDEAIYRLALQITQRAPEESVFIDDRSLNVECGRRMGMLTVHFQGPAQLQAELRKLGVEL